MAAKRDDRRGIRFVGLMTALYVAGLVAMAVLAAVVPRLKVALDDTGARPSTAQALLIGAGRFAGGNMAWIALICGAALVAAWVGLLVPFLMRVPGGTGARGRAEPR